MGDFSEFSSSNGFGAFNGFTGAGFSNVRKPFDEKDLGPDCLKITFKHVYNGLIFTDDGHYPMIEFKIEQENLETAKRKVLFKDVDYKCAWFLIDHSDSSNRLVGPVKIDLEKIKLGKRVVNDANFSNIDGQEIEAISNEPDTIIHDENIPMWMLNRLKDSICCTK